MERSALLALVLAQHAHLAGLAAQEATLAARMNEPERTGAAVAPGGRPDLAVSVTKRGQTSY